MPPPKWVVPTAPVTGTLGPPAPVVVIGVGLVVGVGVGVGVVLALQVGTVMVLSFSVTSPVPANTRPTTVAPESSTAEVDARIVPTKLVLLPSVAELATGQNTLHAWAPFSRTTELLEAVSRVALPAVWKMNTALASPPPFSVTVPLKVSPTAELYNPGARVSPSRAEDASTVDGVRFAASV